MKATEFILMNGKFVYICPLYVIITCNEQNGSIFKGVFVLSVAATEAFSVREDSGQEMGGWCTHCILLCIFCEFG